MLYPAELRGRDFDFTVYSSVSFRWSFGSLLTTSRIMNLLPC